MEGVNVCSLNRCSIWWRVMDFQKNEPIQ